MAGTTVPDTIAVALFRPSAKRFTSFLRYSFVALRPEEKFHGEVDGSTHRLGERELAIRDCVGAYSFCLHLDLEQLYPSGAYFSALC